MRVRAYHQTRHGLLLMRSFFWPLEISMISVEQFFSSLSAKKNLQGDLITPRQGWGIHSSLIKRNLRIFASRFSAGATHRYYKLHIYGFSMPFGNVCSVVFRLKFHLLSGVKTEKVVWWWPHAIAREQQHALSQITHASVTHESYFSSSHNHPLWLLLRTQCR